MTAPGEPNRRRTIAAALAAAVVGGVVAFALLESSPPPPPALMPLAGAAPSAAPRAVEGAAAAYVPTAAALPLPAQRPAATLAVAEEPAWQGKIDRILRSNVSEAQMARMLIGILPTLPEDGQIEAANHIANLLPDSEYDAVRPLLLNASLPESVLSVFFTDLMNRDDSTKLNAFLDIAQSPNHPFHDEALSDLQIYVGDDYGADWTKWKSAVTQYLKTANEQ